MALLSEEDRKRIEAKVAEVERTTAGEIVVASLARSDDYAGRRLLYATGVGLLLASVGHHLWPELETDWVLLMQLPLVAVAWVALGVPSVLRRLVPAAEREQAAQERASRLFAERGVFDTRDHSGVLIMLSELEHRVVMLGDRGIHARVHVEGWQHHVAHIVTAIRAGKPADGVCEVLDQLGAVLAETFPRREDDQNELPDAVVQEDS